jgi:Domain of unknown function (DUF4268)
MITWSRHSRRIDPIERSTYPFCHGDRGESEFGEPLEWQELPGKKASRIALFKYGVDVSDEKQYPELHAWMLSKLDRFRDTSGLMPT